VTAIAVPLLVLVIGWLMFQHIPGWYRPPEIDLGGESVRRIRDDWLGTVDVLSGTIVSVDETFEHRFEQDQINAWLAIREAVWPLSREWLPPQVTQPFVAIDEDGIRLAVTYREGGIQSVVSARLKIDTTPDGIRVRLDEIAGGSLGVPAKWLGERLAAPDRGGWPAGERVEWQIGGPPLPPLSQLTEGVVFPNTWTNEQIGYRPFRILNVRCEPGALVVTLQPLPRQARRR
jgi:hypothetical protein